MSPESLSYYPELMLKCAGLHPYSSLKIVKFCYHHYLNYFFFIFLLFLAILEVGISVKSDIYRAIEGLSSVLFMTLTLFRYAVNYRNKPSLAWLLKNRSKFWHLSQFQGAIRMECAKIMTTSANFIRNYKNYALVLAAIFYIQPFIFHELQMKIYVPEGWFYYLYVVYWYMTPPLFVSVYGVTSMFCAICIPVTIQFKLLAHRFQNFDFNDAKKLKHLVDYHNFLIEYCTRINRYSNGVLVFEFFITISVCCILIFIATNDYPLVDKIKYSGFIVSQFLDTAIFCYNCELISEASENVGKAVYDSLWYESESEIRRNLPLVIARAQKKVTFSGYGLVWINMTTFTQVFKATLSFTSYLNTVTVDEKTAK
ncbi:odorant receptor 85b-like [Tribolium madens]|uniref:odorant receptor 85b-like n=1 Tax=Tribolium madens TaxID=41895 RepID=UPI001CF72D4A|nr:odorant receptor 85b-like [Tribolium madens]